jgi:hypothetical protein
MSADPPAREARRRPRARRGPLRCRLALVLLLATAGTIAPAGVAAAADATVLPVLSCVVPQSSGGFTAVLGYSNSSGSSVRIPLGAKNKFTPTRYDGNQPTTFLPGVHQGVFSVRVTHPSAKWMLGSTKLFLDDAAAPRCPPSTEMPEEGNGTGPAVALLAGGALGVVLLRRLRRRLASATQGAASSSATQGHREAHGA